MRKNRIDSASEAVKIANAEMPMPPDHIILREGDFPHWKAVVRAREFSSWTDVDLEHAANLAACLADIERFKQEIFAEGDVIKNDRGTPIVNPRHALLETVSRRAVALSRMLHVHAEATVGESRHQKKRNQKQGEVSRDKDGSDDDGLIPGVVQ
jgi:hypothetical protein